MYKREIKIDNTITSGLRIWLLKKYAKKISHFFTPTSLNFIGFSGLFFAGLCSFLSSYNKLWLIGTIFGVLIHFFTDEFDGEVARIRKVDSEHGYYIDHMLDMIGILLLFLGIGISPLMHISIAFGLIILYYIISMSVFLTTYVTRKFQISFAKLGPREIKFLIILFAGISMIKYPFVLFDSKIESIGKVTLFDAAGFISLIILTIIAIHTITETIYYLKKFEKTYKVANFFEYIQKTQFMKNIPRNTFFGVTSPFFETEEKIKK